MLSEQIHNFSKEGDKLPGRSTPFPGYPTQAARLWGTCNYPLSLFACLYRQAHALRSNGAPIYIEVCGLRVIQVPHGLSCLLDHILLAYRVWPEGKVWTACAAAVGI